MSLLELEGVNSYYGESHILRDVTMDVEEGQIIALLGRNGAGKTTTLRSITGTTPPEVRSGTIRFDGTDITGQKPEDISARGLSLVPEERRMFSNLTVAENLHVPDISKNLLNRIGRSVETGKTGVSDEEIYEQFSRLDERRDQKAGTLSGGEQQMLAIARTLKQDTKLLMLDEPSEGLAPQIVQDVVDIIQEIADQGKTILLVEQNAAAAIKLADYCYVLDQGSVVYQGTSAEIEANDEVRREYLGV
ncbi:ABC transporter ATP-binding protein [Halorubrum sp. BOL3-1]|uniref:ABC transporter ATP-binding protein n=1 Tax=Halorubrum sp. BOL3-1 TaxID=2497325 RepID=UPI001004D81E|nr:ABC transporter ATP-binding protein [Halorubrum sp. BOL3-1]QAU11935.1 ABC transporter ATP-binding protein [Halorubrum sp. BOL3-1]